MKNNGIPLSIKESNDEKGTEMNQTKIGDDVNVKWKLWKKRRYLLVLLIALGLLISYIIRVNLSVAIVAMTAKSGKNEAEFDWDSKVQGLVLGSFFYGYATTQLLGGWLSSKIGGKKVFGTGIGVATFLTILTPPSAKINVYLLVALRIVEGVIEGGTYPCIHSILENWAPPMERSKLVTFSFSGGFVGTVVGMTASGVMIEYLGWSSVFYIFGGLGLVWSIFWWYVVTDKPEDDPKISETELKYIKQSIGDKQGDEKCSIPWKAILTSIPMWAIVASHFAENWGFYTMLTQLPLFMHDVLHYKIEATGFFSALPYLVVSFTLPISGLLADYMRANYLTTTQVRKVFNCSAFIGQAIFMVATVYVGSSGAAVACITIAIGFGGFAWSGFSVNHLDIAPQYASVLLGLSCTVATIPGIISPILTGYIVKNKKPEEWRYVFFIAGSIYVVGAVIYGIFASGEEQKWASNWKKKESLVFTNKTMEGDTNL